jgi:hypothetical protein
VISKEERSEFVKKYLTTNRLQAFYRCITQAHADYRKKYKDVSHVHMSRTKANIINDTIVDNIKNIFQDDPEVHPYYVRKSSFRLSIGNGAVIVRFKKMDKNMRVHNIPTQQALAFNEQTLLFDDPSVNINVGYVPDGLENKVVVACPQNSYNNHWVWEVEQISVVDDKDLVVAFPVPSAPPSTKRRVVPRREKEKDHEDAR